MTLALGKPERPVRIAVIGAGPSGFYAVQALLKQKEFSVSIDIIDHLPAPYGLVRYGVAPDHQKIKSVTKVYERIASDSRVNFFGNVTLGANISHDELKARYDQIIYAVGAQSDRRLDIPGEDLTGSFPATDFVAWYNGHPDFRDYQFDLTQEKVAVIGVGNVAMDVARILALSPEELEQTDIANYALEALRSSQISDVYVVARRGPAQVKFTNPELRELAELEVTDVIIDPAELILDPMSEAAIADNREAQANLEIMRHYAELGSTNKPKRIHFLFLRSPVEISGDREGRVSAVKMEKNELQPTESGYLNSVGTGDYESLDIGMIARSIGYRGVPLPGVPFHERWAIISNIDGRVSEYESDEIVRGEYVVGWAKRGPTGIIGTNKPDAVATVRLMLEDIPALVPVDAEMARIESLESLLKDRDVHHVSWDDWLILDQEEVSAGERLGRPRVKFTSVTDMLEAIEKAIEAQTVDILIIGGGPAGLYSAFYAGLRGCKARVLEALPQVGGQLATLYPEMDIYDVPGFYKVGASDLVSALRKQAERFTPDVELCTGCRAESLSREDDRLVVRDSQGNVHRARKLIIATGIGAVIPNRLDNRNLKRFEDKGLYTFIHEKSDLRGKKVLVVGGGDSAVLWALNLENWAEEVTLIHRSDRFSASQANLAELRASSVPLLEYHEVKSIQGKTSVEEVTIVDTRTEQDIELGVDSVLLCLGFRTDKSFMRGLGVRLSNSHISVNNLMLTSDSDIYAIGDAIKPEGGVNLKLIATGIAQAAVAANHASHEIDPSRKIVPPHSSTIRL